MMNFPRSFAARIGIVSYDYDPPIGGLGVLVRTYLQSMRTLFPGCRPIVISPSENADERCSGLGRLRHRRSGGCPLYSLCLAFTLGGYVRKHRLDLLHVHAGSGGVFLLRRPRCPLVVTAHHTYRQEADIVYVHSPLKRRWKLFMSLLERRTYTLADRVICVSHDTADDLMRHYGIQKEKIIVIENPLRLAEIEAFVTERKREKTIVFVGRVEPRKGVLLLLEAMEILLKDIPDVRLRLVGNNLLGDALASEIRRRHVEQNVTLLGYLDDPLRFREMAEATVVVVPSTLEGFGLVAAEAMAIGTCVVASDAPGLRSLIIDGKTGLSFPRYDACACAAALRRALTEHDLRGRLAQEARAEARRRFDVVERTNDVMKVLDGTLQEKNK